MVHQISQTTQHPDLTATKTENKCSEFSCTTFILKHACTNQQLARFRHFVTERYGRNELKSTSECVSIEILLIHKIKTNYITTEDLSISPLNTELFLPCNTGILRLTYLDIFRECFNLLSK